MLLALVEVAEVGAEDSGQALGVLALADEVLQFVPEGLQFARRVAAGDLGNALVLEREGIDVLFENVFVFHFAIPVLLFCRSQAVIGVAR